MNFKTITVKVRSGESLSLEEGLFLFEAPDFEPVRALAEERCRAMHQERVYYVVNQHINYSNLCTLRKVCKFCSFARLKKEEGSYEFTIPEILEKVGQADVFGVTEIHMVGGLHPTWPFSYYTDLLKAIHEKFPAIQLKCFTAVEIDHFARMARKSHEWVLAELKESGLKSLTGGGIEIMSQRVRDLICKQKLSAEGWLKIVRAAHKIGIRSNATILFGHLETKQEVLEHLIALRNLQDETGGFLSFIPLRFHPEGNALSHLPGPSDDYTRRMIAISRLMLDNFQHIKSYWISMGVDLARECLHYGSNDLDGTVLEERIYHMAGAETPVEMAVAQIRQLIQSAGKIPIERNALYEMVTSRLPQLGEIA